MLETLLKLLAIDTPCPEIMLEEDGDLGLEWGRAEVIASIHPSGGVSWAAAPKEHGTSLDRLIAILKERF